MMHEPKGASAQQKWCHKDTIGSILNRFAMQKSLKYRLDQLEMPNYSLIEAVRYFHIPFSTVEYWTSGTDPIVKLASISPKMLSFKNLVEFYVLEGLRHIHGLRLKAIRNAVEDKTAEPGTAPPSTPDPNSALLRFCLDRVSSLDARAGNHGAHRGNIVDVGDFHQPD